jgi:hypothetical protein
MATVTAVTVKCIYCHRAIDGHFINDDKNLIVEMGTSKVKAAVGEYNKKRGYLHVSCAIGIKAEEALQEKK